MDPPNGAGHYERAHEKALLSQCDDAPSKMVAHDDWLPDEYRQPGSECYQQYLFYYDPQDRCSVNRFVWGRAVQAALANF